MFVGGVDVLPAAGGVLRRRVVLAGRRVLVVDDEADARILTSRMLSARGADVTVVSSAVDALHAMRTQRFDALVADIGMPSEDGYALVRAIRDLAADEGGRVPAVAVTAYASSRDREQALASGFDAHLPKPVEPGELIGAVAAVISSRKTSRAAPT